MSEHGKLVLESEKASCPYCSSENYVPWASERGFNIVRCEKCALLYVSPRPLRERVDEAIRTGFHRNLRLDVKSRRAPKKIQRYRRVLGAMFADLWRPGVPISWVDVGCGYGEILEAVQLLAPTGSQISGFEPMHVKAEQARALGLKVTEDYLRLGATKADVISAVDIFSHIPDFHSFLSLVADNLAEGGLLFLETGNLADLRNRADVPGELGVPDHLVFAGELHIRGYLDHAGFDIEKIQYVRIDGILDFIKNCMKRALGRPFLISIPYTSKYRQLQIRARRRRLLVNQAYS